MANAVPCPAFSPLTTHFLSCLSVGRSGTSHSGTGTSSGTSHSSSLNPSSNGTGMDDQVLYRGGQRALPRSSTASNGACILADRRPGEQHIIVLTGQAEPNASLVPSACVWAVTVAALHALLFATWPTCYSTWAVPGRDTPTWVCPSHNHHA